MIEATSGTLVYRCAAGVVAVRDADGTRLIDRASRRSWLLAGTAAVIWDLLVVGHPFRDVVAAVAALLALSPDVARAVVAGQLASWHADGILTATPDGASVADGTAAPGTARRVALAVVGAQGGGEGGDG